MRQNARDLTHAGAYVCSVAILLGSAAYATASYHPNSSLLSWMAPSLVRAEPEPTRISVASRNAREIREALARPIAKPEPLSPITAKLAYGHLRPGGKGYMAATAQHKPKRSSEGHDAMAMQPEPGFGSFRSSSAVAPELHKVY